MHVFSLTEALQAAKTPKPVACSDDVAAMEGGVFPSDPSKLRSSELLLISGLGVCVWVLCMSMVRGVCAMAVMDMAVGMVYMCVCVVCAFASNIGTVLGVALASC